MYKQCMILQRNKKKNSIFGSKIDLHKALAKSIQFT